MDGDRQKRVGVKGSSKVDWLSILPESLLCKVLSNLPTNDVVKCSVLSKRWRNLWRYVPGLELKEENFPDYKTFISFVNAFLDFNSESYLENFKLKYYGNTGGSYGILGDDELTNGIVTRWINTVVDRRVKHLVFVDNSTLDWDSWDIQMPPTLYTCESLVSLKLSGVELACPKFVCLPCLKFMDLTIVHFANALDLEMLISGCPVLESLFIEQSCSDDIEVLRVCSQSLLRFTHVGDVFMDADEDDLVAAINAPRLQYLRLGDTPIGNFILNNSSSLVEAYIETVFNWSFKNKSENDLQKRKMVRSFLEGISCVKDMTIGSGTLEVIFHYSRCEQLPVFRNLSFLRASFHNFRWKMLPIFLESCPNLKSLVVASDTFPWSKAPELSILLGPNCLLSSLEYVDIEKPLIGVAMEMNLVSYFLENSATLKKLTVRLAASMKTEESAAIVKELIAIPRLSSSCQVIVL